ncbi:MAG: ROK family protein, partial [Chloroflexi bacterium]
MMAKPLALAIDIGGTKIKAGLIDIDGGLSSLKRLATPAQSPPEHIVSQVVELVHEICAENRLAIDDLRGIGISIAAFISAHGLVVASAHLSQKWIGFDLGTPLRQKFATEFYFALDAPAPALGEAYYGAGKGLEHFAYVTVSTGIGAGMFLGGEYYTGGLGWAGGVGHTIIDEMSPRICHGCGNAGCLETFAAT